MAALMRGKRPFAFKNGDSFAGHPALHLACGCDPHDPTANDY
jgi:hypothetical protein